MKKTLIIFSSLFTFLFSDCSLPKELEKIVSLQKIKNNSSFIKEDTSGLCVKGISFKDGKTKWNMILSWNKNNPKGAFFYLPHNDEKAALSSAIYATKKYGGGFLSIDDKKNNRYYKGIDPNRNFKSNNYSFTVIDIINYFKKKHYPYIALHNNKNGSIFTGGAGTISILKITSKTLSFPSGRVLKGKHMGVQDEDSIIYLIGENVNMNKVKRFNFMGLHVKFELITPENNDYSMSNYVLLNLDSEKYLNIEAEDGDLITQKKMIDSIFINYLR